MSNVTNINDFKQSALDNLRILRDGIESGEIVGVAVSMTYKDGSSGNCWNCDDRPIQLIGELHCLMADMEFYEIELRKHSEARDSGM